MMQFWETTLEKKYYIVLDKNFPFFLAIFVRSMCGKNILLRKNKQQFQKIHINHQCVNCKSERVNHCGAKELQANVF